MVNKYGPQGNTEQIIREAPRIARRLLTEGSLVRLMREYHTSYETMKRYVYPLIRPADIKRLKTAQRRRCIAGGQKTRFKKNHTPWNKDIKGLDFPGSRPTQFKNGCLRGAAARKYRPPGAITIRNDKTGRQFRYIKISDQGPPSRRYIPYARHFWLKHRGPIPPGMFIVHIDGNTLNDNLSNLVLVDRRGHLELTKYRMTPRDEARRKLKAARKQRSFRVNQRRSESLKRTCAKRRLARTNKLWECTGCRADFKGEAPPARCPKCGGGAFSASIVLCLMERAV